MSTSSAAARRHAWLELLQQSGPFLTIPVADQIWPAGLPAVAQPVRVGVRAGVTQLLDDNGATASSFARQVLSDALHWSDALVEGADLPASLSEVVPEHGVILRPDFAFRSLDEEADVVDAAKDQEDADRELGDDADSAPSGATPVGEGPWRLLGMRVPWGSHPLRRTVHARWAASPVERLAALLRARHVPIGLVSDGRWWAVVWAPRGKPVGAAVWDASLWTEEPETLAAFVALLERRRFFGVPPAERLPSLLERSASAQEEVTTALGAQVRAAVEMLVRKLDELDRNTDGTILSGVSDDDLYAGVVTVMMRVVFLLFAEERRLLPSDDARYDAAYSVGRLVEQLEQRAAIQGEQTLEHRTGAWHRLLALARALHGGVAHEDLRLPPYGGGLFDPDRYPWLEGGDGTPPPVDDLTVLRMLDAVQYVRLYGERRRLTFRALDVEQIGYVYEGLLELEVRTATEPILMLHPQRDGIDMIPASVALEVVADGLHGWAASAYQGKKKATDATRKRATRLLSEPVPPSVPVVLQSVLEQQLAQQLVELGPLLRLDERERPMLIHVGGRYVAASTRRAATGAHYTPRSLAEEVVQHALEPLIYRPGPIDTLDRDTWKLRPSTEILALRAADIAIGSGAFLVAACRFLADRLVEAWDLEGDTEASRALAHRTVDTADAEVEGVLLRARRLVAEHCLYGVDVNPLAVEMAKLSLWLVTMDRERPFGFLNDRLVCGDSLLGITSMQQLETLHLDPVAGRQLHRDTLDFGAGWREMLAAAADARRRITATPAVTVRDVEHKARLLAEAEAAAEPLRTVADALTGAGLHAATVPAAQRENVFRRLSAAMWAYETDPATTAALTAFLEYVNDGLPTGKEDRRPFHWPLVFPEIFADTDRPGFDALIGNPPFLGGKKISGALGDDYLAWLAAWDGRGVKGNTDLAARFLLRGDAVLNDRGQLGYVSTNTLVEGETLAVGLLQLESRGWTVRRGTSAHNWPSASASLSIIEIWASKAPVQALAVLDDEAVPQLGADLQPFLRETGRPQRLRENDGIAYMGSIILGSGFVIAPDTAAVLLSEEPRNKDILLPYITGADLNRQPDTSASRWVINFHDWPLERAATYRQAYERVRALVKPERDQKKRPNYRDLWWRFAELCPGLYRAIGGLDHVLAVSVVGNVLLPVRIATEQVFSSACVVIALDDFANFAVTSSAVHQAWVMRYMTTMGVGAAGRYLPSVAFDTFPRPVETPLVTQLGETLDAERRELMLSRALGLTKLYNLVHDPSVNDRAIARLREIHAEVDQAVFAAYGWSGLDPEIGHHQTKLGTRWTVSPQTRFELLDRLLVENHRRFDGEQ